MAAHLKLRVVPNASRSQVVGTYGGAIKVRVAAPAVDGKANAALLDFLAANLGVPKRAVTLVRGESLRDKVVAVEGMSTEGAGARLLGLGAAC